MNTGFTIELKGLQFFSYHGLYKEEKKVGGEFAVDVSATFSSIQTNIHRVEETVNYVKLYEIVKEEMQQPKDLLETVTQAIAENIHKQFAKVIRVTVRIEKKNPPILNFPGTVAVVFEKDF